MKINAVEMTKEIMMDLENRGMIIRLAPDSHRPVVKDNESMGTVIYASDPVFGGHKLISVVIGHDKLGSFGIHLDNEEFLLIGSNEDKPLYLLVSYLTSEELIRKIDNNSVVAEDFICLRCVFNDPEVSFFTMLKGVPHGEASVIGSGRPPKFYVTEPTDLSIENIDLSSLSISIVE